MKNSRAKAPALLIAATLAGSGIQAATLEEVITQTLTGNPQTRASMNRYKASGETVRVARSGYLPTVDLRSGIGWERIDNEHTRSTEPATNEKDFTPKENSLTVNQNLFDGFSTTNEYRKSEQFRESRREQLRARAESLALDVSDVYLRVLDSSKQVELARDNLKTHERIHNLVQQRSDKGVTTQSDLFQSEGRLARARANLITARNNLQDAESQYLRIVNNPPEHLSMPFFDDQLLPRELDEAIRVALKEHPAILSSNHELEASQFGYDSTCGQFLPTLDLSLSQRWDRDVRGISGKEDDTIAMVTMRYNLFNGGADMARRQEAAYRVEENKANQLNTHQAVVESLRMAWSAYVNTAEEQPHLKRHMDASAKTVAAYKQQFEIGKRSLLDVLDSENESYQAKRAYTSANYRVLYARYRILSGMGQMLNKLNIKTPADWQG